MSTALRSRATESFGSPQASPLRIPRSSRARPVPLDRERSRVAAPGTRIESPAALVWILYGFELKRNAAMPMIDCRSPFFTYTVTDAFPWHHSLPPLTMSSYELSVSDIGLPLPGFRLLSAVTKDAQFAPLAPTRVAP